MPELGLCSVSPSVGLPSFRDVRASPDGPAFLDFLAYLTPLDAPTGTLSDLAVGPQSSKQYFLGGCAG